LLSSTSFASTRSLVAVRAKNLLVLLSLAPPPSAPHGTQRKSPQARRASNLSAILCVYLITVFSCQDKKKLSSSTAAQLPKTPNPAEAAFVAKKKAGLKGKAVKNREVEGHVLGGADYVTLMMGGRRKAREEAMKLPREEE
jgi:hypothetical protein